MLVTLLGMVTLVRLVQAREHAVPDVGDAVGDRDVGQAGAVIERRVPDAGDAGANRDAGQAGAVIERRVPDAGDAVGDDVASGFPSRVFDERGLELVKQNSIRAAKEGILCVHAYVQQVRAPHERAEPNIRDAAGDIQVG